MIDFNPRNHQNNIESKWTSIIGIAIIGIMMPLIFHTKNDEIGIFYWIIISVLITFFVWQGSRRVVSFLWLKHPWEKNPTKHLLIIIIFLCSLSIFLITIIFLINHLFSNQSSDYWQIMKGVNVSMVLITFFTTSIYEGIYLFDKWKKSLTLSSKLEKENIQARFEALKNQINPHFLFNSLSTISALIHSDPDKAIDFIDKFSSIYRYVLEIKDEMATKVEQELDFVSSYIFLQKIRFGDNLKLEIDIDNALYNKFILPLSLQILVENAIKHNEISEEYPLKISIYNNAENFIMENNLQQIQHGEKSTKIGLQNLKDRYLLISDLAPAFYIEENKFIARIPFLEVE